MTATALHEIDVASRRRKWPRYPEYKPTGIDWFGSIPKHWVISPLYARYELCLGKMLDTKSITGENLLPYLRNVDVQWDRVNVIDLPEMDINQEEYARFTLRFGDLLVCEGGEVGRSATWCGELPLCAFQKAIHRLRVRSATKDDSRFLFYAMRCLADGGVFLALGNPNTIPHLTGERLRVYRFAFPPLDEQRAIAAFLDRETARIDELIAKKQRLIELLKEKRQAVISRAVTKGLNPDTPMKPSGIDWLGDVPEHWEVCKTKRVACLRTGHTPSRQHPEYWVDCTIPWFSLADVWQLRDGRSDYVGETMERISELGLANSAAELLPAGTVIVSRTASVGFSGIMPTAMATTQDFVNWICGPRLIPEYLLFVFRSMNQEFRRLTMGSTHKTIYMPDVWRFTTTVPPLNEQKDIVAYIRQEKERLEILQDTVCAASARLRDYRSALITAAVTGQIDVRNHDEEAACP